MSKACSVETAWLFDPLEQREIRECGGDPYRLGRIQWAVQLCHGCPLRSDCAESGIAGDEEGVWGGQYLSHRRLRKLGRAS